MTWIPALVVGSAIYVAACVVLARANPHQDVPVLMGRPAHEPPLAVGLRLAAVIVVALGAVLRVDVVHLGIYLVLLVLAFVPGSVVLWRHNREL